MKRLADTYSIKSSKDLKNFSVSHIEKRRDSQLSIINSLTEQGCEIITDSYDIAQDVWSLLFRHNNITYYLFNFNINNGMNVEIASMGDSSFSPIKLKSLKTLNTLLTDPDIGISTILE